MSYLEPVFCVNCQYIDPYEESIPTITPKMRITLAKCARPLGRSIDLVSGEAVDKVSNLFCSTERIDTSGCGPFGKHFKEKTNDGLE